MVTNGSIFIRRGLFLVIGVLLMVGQVNAQGRPASGPQFVCITSQVNPDNDTEDLRPAVSDDYVVWVGYADGEAGEIFAKDRGTGDVTQITDNDYEDFKPRVDGNYVVWEFDNPDNGTKDIGIHNLENGQTDTLGVGSYDDVRPLIEGNYVIWTQDDTVTMVRYHNIATDISGNIGLGINGDRYEAYAINEGRILYSYRDFQGAATYHDYLYVRDLENGNSTLVSGDLPIEDGKFDAEIDGEVVVWENLPQGSSNFDIYAYNMANEDPIPVTDNNDNEGEPTVQGEYIAYRRDTDTTFEMRLYNLETGDNTLLDSISRLEDVYYDPFIEGDRIAWQSSVGIYVYPLGADRTYKVTDYEGSEDLVLEGNRIFWSGQEQGEQDADIFVADCGFKPEIVSQPQDVEIESGQTAMLSVEAKGDGNLKYQWYDNNGETPIIGATSSTFVTAALTETKEFYVKVSSKYGNVASRVVTVVVSEEAATATPDATSTGAPDTTATPTLEVTPTPSMTPTEVLPGSVQLLSNGDFELDADNNKIPDGWTAKGTQVNKADKLKRNKLQPDGTIKQFAYSGESAFMFKGNPGGEKSKIGYKLTDFGVITNGTVLEFSVYVNRFNVAPGTTIGKVKISFSDGSKETLQLITPTEQAYTSVSDTLEVDLDGRTIEKLKVEFSTNITGGKFMIDSASLLVVPAAVAETGLLPLP
jgi:hypothetical protein